MHRVLLGVTAIALAAGPASAQNYAAGGFSGFASANSSPRWADPPQAGVRVHRGFPDRDGRRGHRGGDRRGYDYGYGYAYAGGYYDPGDYDANRSFDPDKWNDWWHERPERAFPRWVWNNQNCTEDRMWWSGSGWRCTP